MKKGHFFYFHLKIFIFFIFIFYSNINIYKLRENVQANIYAAFSKIQLRQIRNTGLINYCENATYYNITQSLSIKGKKKKIINIYKQENIKK